MNCIVIFSIYWLYKIITFTVGLLIGYVNYKNDLKVDWLRKCLDLRNVTLPKHLIVIPIGGAKLDTITNSIDALVRQTYPQKLIYVALSFEERLIEKDPDYYTKIITQLKTRYKQYGDRLLIFIHPKNISCEAIGAAANRTWGNRKAIEILEKRGMNIAEFITTSPDEDIRFHKEYLSALSYKYLTVDRPERKFFQTAVYLFNNNYWEVPMLVRTWSMSLTLPVLASSAIRRNKRETWSCYSLNLKTLEDVGFWDTSMGIDDTPFFWRPYGYFDGDFECEVFYIPLYADSVYHPNKLRNYIEQYNQLVRWGWGVVAFPLGLRTLLENKRISIRKKVSKLIYLIELFIIAKATSTIFVLSIPMVIFFDRGLYNYVSRVSFPDTFGLIMQFMTIFIIPLLVIKYLLIPPPPEDWGKFKRIYIFILEIPLHVLLLYTYAFIPFVVGPTLMMFGKSYTYKVIEKY